MKWIDRVLQDLRFAQVKPYVNAQSRVLDVGCLDGALEKKLGPFADYFGLDPSAPASERSGIRFARGFFPHPDVPADSFDVLTALAVLEHVPRDEQLAFADACRRVLAPGGRLVITVPSPLVDPILDVLMKLRFADGMETEQHYGFKPTETRDLFEGAGFSLEKHARFELGLNHLFVFRRS